MTHGEKVTHVLLSANFEAAFPGAKTQHRLSNNKPKMTEAANSHCHKFKGTHLASTASQQQLSHYSSASSIWVPFNTSFRGTQSFTTRLLSESVPPCLCSGIYLTHLAASLMRRAASSRSPLFSEGAALPLAGFLGSRPKHLRSLWTCLPIPYVEWHLMGLLYFSKVFSLTFFVLLVEVSFAALSVYVCFYHHI